MRRYLAAIAVFALFGTLSAAAAEIMNIIVDKVHIVRLNRDAGVVMIANPNIADVAVESPRLIFVIGRKPGETNLYVLDGNGRQLLHKDLVVRANPERHVTVHRATQEVTFSCAPRCAQVVTPGAAVAEQTDGAAGGAGTAGGK